MVGPRLRFLAGTVIFPALALAVLAPSAALAGPPPARAPFGEATTGACVPGANILCLNSARFSVSVEWKDFSGNTGSGKAIPLTADTGYFWFFTDTNVELVVKVLDARVINGHFWVFYGALSNVEYRITVIDTVTLEQKTYSNPSGEFGSAGDTLAFAASVGSTPAAAGGPVEAAGPSKVGPSLAAIAPAAVSRATACVADATGLCLSGGRFRVEVNWKDFQGKTGRGQAIGLTADTGYFWFFNSANVELVVKVLDARGVNGNFWAFYGALSNVEYEVIVIDTETGESRRYKNPSGDFASAGDTRAFPLEAGTPYPAHTDVGTPLGDAATVSIGPAGGSITSQDGRLKLTIPSGALSGTVDFAVQPITSQAPGGHGSAYRLEPEGQTFATPVEIAFHYGTPDLAGTAPEALRVAYQDDQHFWRAMRSATLNQADSVIAISTRHLSHWSLVSGFQLEPGEATVSVGNSLGLALVFCQQIVEDEFVTLMQRCEPSEPDLGGSGWAVNGVPGGNGTVGTVAASGNIAATYTAPHAVPTPDLVAVSVRLNGSLGGVTTLVSNVKIIDGWIGTAHFATCDRHAISATSEVTWELQGKHNGVSSYKPTRVESTVALAGCTISPSVVSTGNTDGGVLYVDENTTPATYWGVGIYTYPATRLCPPEEPATAPLPVTYFGPIAPGDHVQVSADGKTIDGAFGDGCSTVDWIFRR